MEARVRQPPLTQLCGQIRKESLPIYYASNVFALDLSRCGERQCGNETSWLRAIGPHNRRFLQNLYIWCVGYGGLRAKEECESNIQGWRVRVTAADTRICVKARWCRIHFLEAEQQNAGAEDAGTG